MTRNTVVLLSIQPQSLFRKIASSLPGMENMKAAASAREDLVDVTLTPSREKDASAATSCSC